MNNEPLVQNNLPRLSVFSKMEEEVIETEINKLLAYNVIIESKHCDGEFISPIFVVPKKDGTFRMILNLKALNEQFNMYILKWTRLKQPYD